MAFVAKVAFIIVDVDTTAKTLSIITNIKELVFTVINFIFTFIAIELIIIALGEMYCFDYGCWPNSKTLVVVIIIDY